MTSSPLSIHCPHCQRRLKIENRSLLGKKVKCPGCSQPFVLAEPEAESTTGRVSPPERPRSDPSPTPPEPPLAPPETAAPAPAGDLFEQLAQMESRRTTTARQSKSRTSPRWTGPALIAGGVVAVLMIGGLLFRFLSQPVAALPQPQPQEVAAGPVTDLQVYSRKDLQQNFKLVEEFQPTDGKPIQLLLMPGGVNLLVHLRPALFWSEAPQYRTLRASLTEDVTNWLATRIEDLCRIPAGEIDELTIGLILGARGTEPQLCAVVRLPPSAQLKSYAERFPDINVGNSLGGIQKAGDRAYLVRDDRTMAIGPVALADEMLNWTETPNPEVTAGMAQLLGNTDQLRLFSVVGNLDDLRIHADALLPQVAAQPVGKVLDWFGDNVETVSWSIHDDPYLHSEVQLRPASTSDASRLAKEMQTRLKELPESMWKEVCLKLAPQELRFRQLIGRFPAMLEAVREATVLNPQPKLLVLTTVLPEKAAPNLALATLFTIHEVARTDFTPVAAMPGSSAGPALPDSAAQRLQLPVDAEFKNMPLEQAMQYLCDEIKLQLVIDGDALKDAGYTRNMPQTINLGRVPAQQAILTIVKNYQEAGKEMAVSLNEESKSITLTTRKFAASRQLPVMPLE
ncbi:hypothetical protein [Planctomicrobium sp. SH664]|uniref:hypothetical protein n=1 Tax=Planctomicrobium sp. SH664 TaxID=3448125 RepID=UPI003F5B6991